MNYLKLWRFETSNPVPDNGYKWFFWQSSAPYKLSGRYVFELVPSYLPCEVYTLGSRDMLYSGLLHTVPRSMRSYLSEVRVCIASLNPSRA
jgi:hypothetical protein